MTLSIQRSPEASNALLERFENPQPPINSQLTVANDECVVVALNGAVLGVVPPGVHWLHPQPFPFLVPAIVGGNLVQAELWFVKTVTMVGIRFGGALGSVTDPLTNVECMPRAIGTFALTVRDPVRVVQGCMGQGIDAEPLLAWAKQVVMRQLASALGIEVAGGRSVLAQDLIPAVLERLPGELGELEESGLAATHFGEVMLSFSEEDRTALSDAQKRAVQAKLAAAVAAAAAPAAAPPRRCTQCGRPHEGGRFCVDCGGALASG
jgi:membrane protease subunit (stomatin/prohibitin family)